MIGNIKGLLYICKGISKGYNVIGEDYQKDFLFYF